MWSSEHVCSPRQLMSGLVCSGTAQSAVLPPPTTTSSSACYNTTCRDDLEDGRASRFAAMISRCTGWWWGRRTGAGGGGRCWGAWTCCWWWTGGSSGGTLCPPSTTAPAGSWIGPAPGGARPPSGSLNLLVPPPWGGCVFTSQKVIG